MDEMIAASLMRALDSDQLTNKLVEHITDKLINSFSLKCTELITEATLKTDEKIENIHTITTEHEDRIAILEKTVDEVEQQTRGLNLIIRGIEKTDTPKKIISKHISEKMGINTKEHDIRYAMKITWKKDCVDPNVESYKISLFDRTKRDEIYTNKKKLIGTNIYVSEDLTLKRSKLAYQARQHAKTIKNSSTWTSDGRIFFKDDLTSTPRIIHATNDLEPQEY